MRRGEVCGQRWRDVDVDAGTLRIEGSVVHAEVGIVGLLLYFRWFAAVWWQAAALKAAAAADEGDPPRFLPSEVGALVVAMAVSMLAGEIVYPYRAAFAFMGSFLFLCAIMTHPALVFGAEAEETEASEALEPASSVSGLRPLWS